MKNESQNCQSCGMPLKQDPNGGGTNADRTKSKLYCSYCYADGRFTQPDITVDEMKAFVVEKLREMKIPRFIGRLLTRNLHKLERWRRA
jgi:hypothetical protein